MNYFSHYSAASVVCQTSPLMTAQVGIVGAGQLAQMTVQAAISLALDITVLATAEGEPATRTGAAVLLGRPDDPAAVQALAERVEVVTFDHEQVDPAQLDALDAAGHVVRPGGAVLRFSDKAHQRTRLGEAGFPVPPFVVATDDAAVEAFAAAHGPTIVAKSATGGYDGHGVFVVAGPGDLPEAARPAPDRPLVLEPRLTLERELAVLIARNPSGEHETYAVVDTIQRDGICNETVAPARIDATVAAEACDLAARIAEHVGSNGMLAVELFVTADGLLVNELAPRPHNSGHWTIEGAATSQFENHLRGVLDLPIGSTELHAPAVATVNVLGPADGSDPRDRLAAALAVRDTHVHLYGKAPRAGRKLGHVTATAHDPEEALARAWDAVERLTGEPR